MRWRARKAAGKAANPGAAIPGTAGAPLPDDARRRMEPKLGADLSGVRVHHGAESADAADQMNARAFTVGSDVHFGAGEFAPGSKEGDKLLAHELTHVVQGQKGGGVHRKATHDAGGDGAADEQTQVSQPEDPAEQEADEVAQHVGDELHGGGGAGHEHGSPQAPAASGSPAGAGKKISRKPKTEKGAAKDEGAHAGKRDIDKRPGAQASDADWVHYLNDLQRFLRDQTGAEKEQLLDIRAHREEHPVVGAISEAAASVKARENVKVPDEGIWDQVFAQLNKAQALFAGDKPNIEDAKREMASAVKLFEEAHRKTYEYRTRTEGGAQTAATTLRGIEIGCDITLTLLSAGVGAGSANVLKLGARGVFKLVAEQTMKGGLLKTAAKAAAVGGANKLAQGGAEEGAGVAAGTEDHFDVAKVLREAGEAAAMNFLGVLIGGSLSKVFMRQLGGILGSRMAPEGVLALAEKYGVEGVIPPELFVSKGWRFLVGVAGDACTTTLLTGLSTLVDQLRTGGKRPTGEQFVQMVITQMIQNGLLQIVLTAVTHGKAKGAAKPSPGAGGGERNAEHAPAHEGAGAKPHGDGTAPDGAANTGGGATASTGPERESASAHDSSSGAQAGKAATKAPAGGAAAPETVDLFVQGNVPKSGPARWKYIENPEVWAPERRALHVQLIAQAKKEAQKFADAAENGNPTMHAMRGNTAAGKSRAVKQNPELAGPMGKAPNAAVNPDNFKPRLMSEGGQSLTSSQVHSESSMLASRLETELLGMKTSDGKEMGSMLIDKRLPTVEDVMHYAELAKQSGRKLSLHDVDAPLEVSLAGVLERRPGGDDPLPPFDVVKTGFDAVRTHRKAVINLFRSNPDLGSYELYATKPTGERVKIAQVEAGEAKILDEDLFKEVIAGPDEAAELVASKTLTETVIKNLTAKLPAERAKAVAGILQKYLGQTWKAALDAHSQEKAKAPKRGG